MHNPLFVHTSALTWICVPSPSINYVAISYLKKKKDTTTTTTIVLLQQQQHNISTVLRKKKQKNIEKKEANEEAMTE